MSAATTPPRLAVSDQAAEHLGRLISACGYTQDGLAEVLGMPGLRGLDSVPFRILAQRITGDGPIEVLTLLFLAQATVDDQTARAALELDSLEPWIEQGILVREEGGVSGAFLILPGDKFVIAGDWPGTPDRPPHRDHVLGDNQTAEILGNVTVPGSFHSVLDLGAGGGIQALGATTHADAVVATDINERAVELCRLNARINDREIETIAGNLFEPVAGRRFDLIISNPPFVIAPETAFTYRDSELGGEGIVEAIIAAAPDHLEDGGWCQLLCNITKHGDDDDWHARLRDLIAPTGLSAWAIVLDEFDAADYAVGWLRQAMIHDPDRFARELDRWVGYYRERGITAVAFCVLTMRRRGDVPFWFDVIRLKGRLSGRAGAQVRRGFQARELIHSRSTEELLGLRVVFHPDVRLETTMAPEGDGWVDISNRLVPEGGLPFAGSIGTNVANLIVRCNGERTLGEVMTMMAEISEVDNEAMVEGGMPLVQQLMESGVLVLEPG